MDVLKPWYDGIALIANMFTIVASGIAIGVFIVKRKQLVTALTLLLNWSYKTSLADIVGKLDRLNEYNASELGDLPEIRNILHEIAGQIRGNPRILEVAPLVPDRLESLASSKKLSEPHKRSMVAEMRELIRNLQLDSIEFTSGD